MKVGYLVFDENNVDHVGIIDKENLSVKQILNLSGANLGNFAFKYALKGLISEDITLISYQTDWDYVKNNIDILVMPEANLVNVNINYGRQAEFIEYVNKPCLLSGVGAQANNVHDPKAFPEIPEGTVKFLKSVSKRTPFILARGQFTKEVLARFSINNVVAVGCPSFLINPSKHLWKKIVSKARCVDDLENFIITEGVYPSSTRSDNLTNTERKLFDFVLSSSGSNYYLGQVQTSVVAYGLNKFDYINRDDVYYLKEYLANNVTEEKFVEVLKRSAKAFTRIDEWLQFYKGVHSTVGTRIHGNILSIQANTPALPIVHDSRTIELCNSFKMPFCSMDEFLDTKTNNDFIGLFRSKYEVDSSILDQHRQEIAAKYLEVFFELGLNGSEKLMHLGE